MRNPYTPEASQTADLNKDILDWNSHPEMLQKKIQVITLFTF